MILVRPSTSAPISVAEELVDLLAGRLGVLDRVVQHGRHDGGVVEPELGQHRRHLERMRHIGIAGSALLRPMRLHGVHIGAVQQRLVRIADCSVLTRSTSSYCRIMGAAKPSDSQDRQFDPAAYIGAEPAAPQVSRTRNWPPHARRPSLSALTCKSAGPQPRKSPDEAGLLSTGLISRIRWRDYSPSSSDSTGGTRPSRPRSRSSSVMRSNSTPLSSPPALGPPISGTNSGSGSSTSTCFCSEWM